jgi:hypothetical protein
MKYGTKEDYLHALLLVHFYAVGVEVPSKCSHIILCRDAIIQSVMGLKKKPFRNSTYFDSFMFSCILVHDEIYGIVYVLLLDFSAFQNRNGVGKMAA